jgi:predicted nucleic acid-binding protein
MIWIYEFDPHSPESQNVKKWMRGEKGALNHYDDIILSTIIPLEVLHAISKKLQTNYTLAYNAVLAIVGLQNVNVIDFDSRLLLKSMEVLGKYRTFGIGGRDASILAAMDDQNVNRIATHDKNILSITDYQRIDPVFTPPLILKVGEPLDRDKIESRLKNKFQ